MPHLNEPSPGVFVVHLPLPMKPTTVNVTLVCGGDEWALIDTGMHSEESLAALMEAMNAAGCAPRAIRTILATHHHPDHFGASAALRELTGATVRMHRLEYESSLHYAPGRRTDESLAFFLRHGIPLRRFGTIPSPGEFWSQLYRPAVPDRFLADGDEIVVGELRFEVIETPGHTRGHCVFYLRERKLLIVGDHLLPKITPHVGVFPGGPENPLQDFLDSQRRCRALEVERILPAHGGVYSDHRSRIDQIILHHEYRLKEILDIVRRSPHVAYDVARAAFGFEIDSPFTVQFPATFETIAHLELLRSRDLVRREERGDEIFYAAVRG